MAEPDIYGDLCADLPPTAAPEAAPAAPAAAPAVPGRNDGPPTPRRTFRARNLVWKPPADGAAKPPDKSDKLEAKEGTDEKPEVIDLESLEELPVLNTKSFTAPPHPPPSVVPSGGAPPSSPSKKPATEPAVSTAGGSVEAPGPAGSGLPGANHPEFIAVSFERSRGRNLQPKVAAEAENNGASQDHDPNELKVLNSSAASMPDGLDIYGDLCSDLPRTSAQGIAGEPGKSYGKGRPRARNLVWKSENPSRPSKDPKDAKDPKGDSKEEDEALDAAPLQTQQQEAALQKVLAEEADAEAGGSPVSEEVEDSDDDGSVHLGEVLASQTALRAPPGAPANAVQGSHWAAPVPGVPCARRPAEGFLLLAGVPAWLTDAELRKHATQFGQVRNLRTLCDGKGKSAGILLLEYSDVQAVRRATEANGICRIRLLQGFGIAPRAMLVGAELHSALCCPAGPGLAPWPDGGSCGEELRQKLMDAFGVQPVGSKKRTKAEDAANLTEEIKKLKGVPLASIPAREVPSKAGEDWAKKLKGMKGAVHPAPKDGEDWANRLNKLKGAVHPSPAAAAPVPPPEKATASWAEKLKKLKGAVNSHGGRG